MCEGPKMMCELQYSLANLVKLSDKCKVQYKE